METRQTTLTEEPHNDTLCWLCGRQHLEWCEEAGESICPNCGWPIGR